MPKEIAALQAFNRGIVSPLGLARTDITRLRLAAETHENYMPRVLGSMMLRPGLEYLDSTNSNSQAYFLPFVFSTTDTALIEFTDVAMRVWLSDTPITRPSVTTTITNGTFDSDIASWTDNSEAGSSAAWVTGGYAGLTGSGTTYAILDQQVTIGATDLNKEHAVRVVVERGPVTLRIGTSQDDDDLFTEASLGEGEHSLSFTPSTDFWVQLRSSLKRQVQVDSITIESSGAVSITSPYAEADLDLIRYRQSADVVYIGCTGYQQYKVERRTTRSWSLVKYLPEDGPFRTVNLGATTITPSALSGNITLASSAPLFKSTNVGALWRITSNGQEVETDASAQNTFTNTIIVSGVDSQRLFQINISGTWVGTVTLQRSLDSEDGPFEDLATYTTNQTAVDFDDGFDNVEAWYRLGIKTGDYTSGTATMNLTYPIGAIDGIVRITAYTDSQNVNAEVISDLGGTDATDDWGEGAWSDRRGYPSAPVLYEGRLFWAGMNRIWGSISDAYESFDDTTIGDSGPIDRTIGEGPVDTINWFLPLQRLIFSTDGTEYSCKSSSFDEPLTPTAFSIKTISTQGSAKIEAVRVDKAGYFVARGGTRLYEIKLNGGEFEYEAEDMTVVAPEVLEPGVVRLAVQRKPDTRLHCVLSDGTVAVMVTDRAENVNAWIKVNVGTASGSAYTGVVEDVVVIPGSGIEDDVYYVVKRTINGATKRYLEKWATESQCQGGTLNRQVDSFVTYSGASTTSVTGADHLEGETVYVWGGGKDLGSYTVSSGAFTLSEAVTDYVYGLYYKAQWKSMKLAYAGGLGTALTQKKRVGQLGLILSNTHKDGITYGRDFNNLDPLPATKDGAVVADDTVHTSYDEEASSFGGTWDTDSRICLESESPKPCTVLAAVVPVETHDKY